MMVGSPEKEVIQAALSGAAKAHHEYEREYLDGERDDDWAGWYAAFVLGRVGPFVAPSQLALWLSEAPAGDDWAGGAADYVIQKLEQH